MDRFGDRLRHARSMAGLTQEQLGFAVGVTKSSVSAWENHRELPSFQLLPALRRALQQSLDSLICGEDGVQDTAASYGASGLPQALDAREHALLQRYRALSTRQRAAVLEVLAIGERRDV